MKRLTPIPSNRPLPCLLARLQIVALIVFFLGTVGSAHGADFFCSSGDVTCLIASINQANGIPGSHTITLEPGVYMLETVDNVTDGANGLPSIMGPIEIKAFADGPPTVIERDPGAPPFRIFHVSLSGELSLEGLTVRRGLNPTGFPSGPAILNRGTISLQESMVTDSRGRSGGVIHNTGRLTVYRSIIAGNSIDLGEGGIDNESGGVAIVESSTIARNRSTSGAGISNAGSLVVRNSSILFNQTDALGGGGGILNRGSLEIVNSTIAGNQAGENGGAVSNRGGQVFIVNSTIRDNRFRSSSPFGGGGIANRGGTLFEGGTLRVQNTIIAGNMAGIGPDCFGEITSLGNNLVGNPSGCDINLQPTDLTGDPGLGDFIDDGAPGHARYPVLPTSPVIDAGDAATCPPTDQLDTPRRGICEIGAVEFYPVVNNLIDFGNIRTDFDPTPVANGPAGTFHITADFINNSGQTIVHPFAEVIELTNNDLLLNANGGAGGVGARVKFPDVNSPFSPGATQTLEFVIGLQTTDRFTFLVNVLGDPQTSN